MKKRKKQTKQYSTKQNNKNWENWERKGDLCALLSKNVAPKYSLLQPTPLRDAFVGTIARSLKILHNGGHNLAHLVLHGFIVQIKKKEERELVPASIDPKIKQDLFVPLIQSLMSSLLLALSSMVFCPSVEMRKVYCPRRPAGLSSIVVNGENSWRRSFPR